MKVKCIAKTGGALADVYLLTKGFTRSTDFNISIGREYVVYAMDIYADGKVYYYIADDAFSYYPCLKPASLFEMVDGRLPNNWSVSFLELPLRCRITFGEWNNTPKFLAGVIDKEVEMLEVFIRNKKAIDQWEESLNQ